MVLECGVCLEEAKKLKKLTCKHGFCVTCLEKVKSGIIIACPVCRAETTLSPSGVKDLETQFPGTGKCETCQALEDINQLSWCHDCSGLFCSKCVSEHDPDHNMGTKGHSDLVSYYIQQLENFASLHANLCQIQKDYVTEYFDRLKLECHKMLDLGFADRLSTLKAEKQWIEKHFDKAYVDQPGGNRSPHVDSGKFIQVQRDLKKLIKPKQTSSDVAHDLDIIPRDGIIFSPPPIKEARNKVMSIGRFSTFNPPKMAPADRKVPVAQYIGSGILNHPVDLCPIPGTDLLMVSSTQNGIYVVDMVEKKLVGRKIPEKDSQQYASIEYNAQSGRVLATTLDDYKNWNLRIFQDYKNFEQLQCITCPESPEIAGSWYRWLTILDRNNVLLCTGDKTKSVLWHCNLQNQSWNLLFEEEKSTYRQAAVKTSSNQKEFIIFIPDMHKQRIRTLTLAKNSFEVTGTAEIEYEEASNDIPVALGVSENLLVVGYWIKGDIVVAKLNAGMSYTLANLGPRELLAMSLNEREKKLYALCKQKEIVLAFDLK